MLVTVTSLKNAVSCLERNLYKKGDSFSLTVRDEIYHGEVPTNSQDKDYRNWVELQALETAGVISIVAGKTYVETLLETTFSGYSGASGTSGTSGYSGKSGYSGASGISGISGYSGKSGYSGV